MKKLKQITLLPFNMAIYKRLWDNKLIDDTIFDRNGKYIKNNKVYISDKAYGELIIFFDLDKKEMIKLNYPLELKIIRNTISDIKSVFYQFQIDFCMLYQKHCDYETELKKYGAYPLPSYNGISFFEWMSILKISNKLAKLNNLKYNSNLWEKKI